jgi:hypothetical protein
VDIGGVFHAVKRHARPLKEHPPMQVLVKTNNAVRLNFLVALLRDAGITAEILDNHMSAVEGSIGAIPRRLAVADDDASRARRVLMEAGEEDK